MILQNLVPQSNVSGYIHVRELCICVCIFLFFFINLCNSGVIITSTVWVFPKSFILPFAFKQNIPITMVPDTWIREIIKKSLMTFY